MKAITVRYIGPTNTRGARMKADDGDGNSVTISYDYELSRGERFRAAARALCDKMNWHGRLCEGWTKGGAVYVFIRDSDCFDV